MDFDVTKHGHGVGRLTYLRPDERPRGPQFGDVFDFLTGFDPEARGDMERIIESSAEIEKRPIAAFEGGGDVLVVARRGEHADWFKYLRERFAESGYELTEEAPGP